ncbi:beta-ketoacyl-ACP synthase III [Gammaproteobacteria bacterium]|nr:beta-ketoacyl-ACP synthase III [Gammaproteobacteria bacterium]
MHDIYISGTGHWKASHLTTNEEIVASFNDYVRLYNIEHEEAILAGSKAALGPSSVEFIEKASGIKTRYLIDKKNSLDTNVMRPILSQENPDKVSILAEMSIHAAKEALDQAGIKPADVDAVILGTSHISRNYPAIACEVMDELGIEGYGYDMLIGCSSTTFGISNAYSDIASGLADTVLVVNPELTSPHNDFTLRDSHFIFGDACVATVVQRDSKSDKRAKIIDRKLVTKFSNNIRSDFGYLNRVEEPVKEKQDLFFKQNGKSVFKEVCPMVASLIMDQLGRLDIKVSDISQFWLHQANANMCRVIMTRILGTSDYDPDIAPMILGEFGNVASAGSVLSYHLNNKLQQGDKGIICSFGAGYSICSLVIERS